MPRNHDSSQQSSQKSRGGGGGGGGGGGNGVQRGQRFVLSARAQSALMWILEDIIEKTLMDANRMAREAGKQRVELNEIELALKKLCEQYHTRWQNEASGAKARGLGDPPRKNRPKRL